MRDSSYKVKPKHYGYPLVAGCSISQNPTPFMLVGGTWPTVTLKTPKVGSLYFPVSTFWSFRLFFLVLFDSVSGFISCVIDSGLPTLRHLSWDSQSNECVSRPMPESWQPCRLYFYSFPLLFLALWVPFCFLLVVCTSSPVLLLLSLFFSSVIVCPALISFICAYLTCPKPCLSKSVPSPSSLLVFCLASPCLALPCPVCLGYCLL